MIFLQDTVFIIFLTWLHQYAIGSSNATARYNEKNAFMPRILYIQPFPKTRKILVIETLHHTTHDMKPLKDFLSISNAEESENTQYTLPVITRLDEDNTSIKSKPRK